MKFGFITTEGGSISKSPFMEKSWVSTLFGWGNIMALAGMTTRTMHVMLGADIIVLPFYHPVRAAEDMAMLDVISGGRASVGAAIGSHGVICI